jgi:hypothetical protein
MRTQHPAPSPTRVTLVYALVLVAFTALYRLVPYYLDLGHDARFWWNLTPVGALGLFAGARLRSPLAWLLPVVAMFLSDLLLIRPLAEAGLPAFSRGTVFIYASFAVYAFLGWAAANLPGRWRLAGIGGACLVGSVQFFIVSNFAVWLFQGGLLGYPETLAGLIQCYAAALPFFRNTVGGDVLFTAGFFALHFALLYLFEPRKVSQPA